ncbi:AlpA family phage regulatory protein [Mesorhizobium sp. M1405]|uniref:helix-turn-helix transcriptional regulator n=1 Tax=Mesorhizobium sp. M1405 TaxID=2957098 RepID=UPI00333623DD
MDVQTILRRDAVERISGLPRSTLYAKIASGEFPRPIKIGVRSVGWLEQDVAAWQARCIGARAA